MSYTGRLVLGTDIKTAKLSLTKSGIWEEDPWRTAPSFSWRHCYLQRHCKDNRPIILQPIEVNDASHPRRLVTELKAGSGVLNFIRVIQEATLGLVRDWLTWVHIFWRRKSQAVSQYEFFSDLGIEKQPQFHESVLLNSSFQITASTI